MAEPSRQEQFSGTKDVAPQHVLDAVKLERYLSEHVPGFAGPLTIRQFKGGQSNPTYQLVTPEDEICVAPEAAGEAVTVGACGRSRVSDYQRRSIRRGFRCRSPTRCATDESVAGTMFYVMECVEGRVIWEPQLPGLEPKQRFAIYDAMNETLSKLHQTDYMKLGLEDFRQAGQLFRAADFALGQAVCRVGDGIHSGDEQADGMAAAAHSAGRAQCDRAWRLPAGQYDLASERTARACRARLGDFRRSAIRWPISPITSCNGGCRRAVPAAARGV